MPIRRYVMPTRRYVMPEQYVMPERRYIKPKRVKPKRQKKISLLSKLPLDKAPVDKKNPIINTHTKDGITSLWGRAQNYLKKSKLLSYALSSIPHPAAQMGRHYLKMQGYGRNIAYSYSQPQSISNSNPNPSFFKKHKSKIMKGLAAGAVILGSRYLPSRSNVFHGADLPGYGPQPSRYVLR